MVARQELGETSGFRGPQRPSSTDCYSSSTHAKLDRLKSTYVRFGEGEKARGVTDILRRSVGGAGGETSRLASPTGAPDDTSPLLTLPTTVRQLCCCPLASDETRFVTGQQF